MELEEDEDVILDDGIFGFRKKLVLTNKRIIVQKAKGLFSISWKTENEIPLSEIEEATEWMDPLSSLSSMILKFKNKEKIYFNFKLTDSEIAVSMLGETGSTLSIKSKAITDKYVTAINHQLNKKAEENPLKILQIRFAKGEISKEEYEEMKRVLDG
jgi:hypothetical protein